MSGPTPFLDGALGIIYAEPPEACPACGFPWAGAVDDALRDIEQATQRIIAILRERDGTVAQADGSWNATAYAWHLTDLARSWAERWAQLRADPGSTLVGWDPDVMAAARGYRSLPTSAALWALRDATDRFLASTAAIDHAVTFEHGEWGRGDVADGVRWVAHEFRHHVLDVDARAMPRG